MNCDLKSTTGLKLSHVQLLHFWNLWFFSLNVHSPRCFFVGSSRRPAGDPQLVLTANKIPSKVQQNQTTTQRK